MSGQKKFHIDENGRVCTGKCKQYKLWDQFVPDKHATTGYTAMCRECRNVRVNEKNKNLTEEQREKNRIHVRNWRQKRAKRQKQTIGHTCPDCNTYKLWVDFTKDGAGYTQNCTECRREKDRERANKFTLEQKKARSKKTQRWVSKYRKQEAKPSTDVHKCGGPCGKVKPFSEFGRDRCSSTGYTFDCKECRRKKGRVANLSTQQVQRVRQRRRDKYYTDVRFRIRRTISSSVWVSLKKQGVSKKRRKWETLVGYTVEDLMVHLESRFTDGMSWDNYGRGGWSIDHIIPVTAFQFVSSQDKAFKECWSLSNLQPLWEADNIRKGNKLDWQPSTQAAGG